MALNLVRSGAGLARLSVRPSGALSTVCPLSLLTRSTVGAAASAASNTCFYSSKTPSNKAAGAGAGGDTKWVGLTNDQDFWQKNDKLKRPMSPHLTIYRFPLPAILSISHRGTGVGMTCAVSAAAITLAAGGEPAEYYIEAIKAMNLSPATITAAKFTMAFPNSVRV